MIFCSNCGTPITGESPSEGPAQRKPCPQCGSLARAFEYPGSGGVTVGGSADTAFVSYPEALLSTAQRLIAEGEFANAVAIAHMACEISTENALSRTFATKGIGYLEESIEDLLPSFSLANDRVRNLYNAVTGNEIQKQPFWQTFKESAKRRNDIARKGKGAAVTKMDAEDSFKAVSDLIMFLK